MKSFTARGGTSVQGSSRQRWSSKGVGRLSGSIFGTVLAGIIFSAQSGVAQVDFGRLTVRPHEMAMGTGASRAGAQKIGDEWVYVPQQCVGQQKCPLLELINLNMYWMYPTADKYGIILHVQDYYAKEKSKIEASLKVLFQRLAIDPDRIAILGRCAGLHVAAERAAKNLAIFSRVLLISGGQSPGWIEMFDPPNEKTIFFVEQALSEPGELGFRRTRTLRQGGHKVKQAISIRDHGNEVDDYSYVGRWLYESWIKPDSATLAPAPTIPEVPLTTEALVKMTAFWKSFRGAEEPIRMIGRREYLREVAVSVGKDEVVSVQMVNMEGLAAKYLQLNETFRRLKWTAKQHDIYRVALISALATKREWQDAQLPNFEPTPIQKQNIEFLAANPTGLQALQKTGIWLTP